MSSNPAVLIEPQADVIRVVVNQPQLNDTAIDKLFAEVSSAAAQHSGLPVVLDLTAVNYVPSMALGTLVMVISDLCWWDCNRKCGRCWRLLGWINCLIFRRIMTPHSGIYAGQARQATSKIDCVIGI
jgi:hypothetical protein